MAAVLAGGAAPGGAGFSDVPSQVPEQASSSRARKLGVTDRDDAATRATETGLL